MNLSSVELPSNRKFGFFLTVIFLAACSYFFFVGTVTTAGIFGSLAMLFLLVTIAKDDVLLPLNKLWMRIGLLLGMIVSPIVLGLIFFVLFTPIALIMRVIGRDELRLRLSEKESHWIERGTATQTDSFKYQF
tara:strand:+ start:190 stop:588 length:399 start_codon:yes stop_codon:yes gene_type:complete